MELRECIDDPEFRVQFAIEEKDGLEKVVEGNKNMTYHNEAKISILTELGEGMELTDEEEDVLVEHIGTLTSINQDIVVQSKRLGIMVSLYEKFIKKNGSKLKLA